MPFPWEKDKDVVKPEATPEAPKEKTPAELIAEALSPISNQFNEFRNKLDQIEQNAVKKPEVPRTPQEVTSVLENEDAAFSQRLTPLLARQFELEARVVKNDVKREYESAGFGDLWNQYSKDIDQSLEAAPLVTQDGQPLRGNPAYIRNVVDMVFGRAAREAGMRFDGSRKSFFLESAGGGNNNTQTPEADGFSDSQRRALQKWGISQEDAKKSMSKLRFIQ